MLFRCDGATASGQLGSSVAAAGDVNRDGFTDVIVGSPFEDPNGGDSGAARVYSGRDGSVLFTWSGDSAGDQFGFAVGGGGDVDGDGYADLVVSAPQDDNTASNAGSARVFSGRTGLALYTFNGDSLEDQFGTSVCLAGDIDADGFADIVVGCYRDDNTGTNAGSARVFSGHTGVVLRTFDGSSADDYMGWAVARAGDVDRDGFDDVLVAEPRADFAATRAGRVWLFSGEWITKTAASQIPLTSRVLRTLDGPATIGYQLGLSIAGGGDVNGDGVPDIVAGAPLADVVATDAGAARIYSGATGAVLFGMNGGSAGDQLGDSVGIVGDVNGDGRADVVVGAPFHDAAGVDAGRVWLRSGFDFTILATFDGEAPGDRCGDAVSGAGDVSRSGRSALIVGSPFANRGANDSGTARVFGDATPSEPRDVVLFDADGDGDLDAATANAGTADVSVYLNDGTGSFGVPRRVPLGAGHAGPVAVAAGDLDGDGAADDLAVACADSHTVVLLRDPGGASPIASALASGGRRPVAIAIGDLDGVAPDDVVLAREGAPIQGGGGIAVRLGGAGFVDVSTTAAVSVAVRDLDGDGDADVVAVLRGSPDRIALFAGDGNGGLGSVGTIDLPSGGYANAVACEDFDGDGGVDLAVVVSSLFPTPSTVLRTHVYSRSGALAPGEYAAAPDLTTGGSFAVDVAGAELDADSWAGVRSRRDVVVVHAGSGDAEAHHGFDPATRLFGASAQVASGTGPVAVAVGDLDADGADDVVVCNRGSGDLTVSRGVVRAMGHAFGAGCGGSATAPVLATVGLPIPGNAAFGLQLSQAGAFAPALVLFAGGPQDLALGGGCTLYVELPAASVLRFTNGLGAESYVFGVPNDAGLIGLDLFFQEAVFALGSAGAYAGVLDLSNGVWVQVGS